MPHTNYAVHLELSRDKSWRKILSFSINDWRVSAYSLVIVSIFLVIISSIAHGDEMTGTPQEDTKEMSYTTSGVGISYTTAGPSQPSLTPGFLSMPGWAHTPSMAALPYQLTPMGKKPVVTTTSSPSVDTLTLAPPKETVTPPAPPPETKETVEKPAPATAPEAPALIAVSPFLQWIKSNPKAAEEAREQANRTTPQTPASAPNSANTTTAGPAGNTNSQDPYWLPPLIDSAEFGTAPVGGSAAIYSTPQR